MNILSLFDGISCGRIALERANIPVDRYYASEIDKSAITVSLDNYPDITQLGDIRKIDPSVLPQIDLLIGGSPCTNLSCAGRRNGFSTKEKTDILSFEQYQQMKADGVEFDGQSYLFWEYIRILREVKPRYFLLENVKMAKKWEDIFTRELNVEPIEINSSLVSAQNRKRLYWTNIPNISAPEDKHICLQDVLENVDFINPGAIRGRNILLNKATIIGRRIDENGHRKDYDHTIPIIQCLEVRSTNVDKCNCLTTVEKDNVLTPLSQGRHVDAYGIHSGERLPFRHYTRREYERLQTLLDGYTDSISENKAKKAIGNGWTVDVIAHIFSGLHDVSDI